MTTRPEEENGVAAAMMDEEQKRAFPVPPTFSTKVEEREYLKFRLAQAFRIFGVISYLDVSWPASSSFLLGSLGFNEGVAGHITVRVSFVEMSARQLQTQSLIDRTGSYQDRLFLG